LKRQFGYSHRNARHPAARDRLVCWRFEIEYGTSVAIIRRLGGGFPALMRGSILFPELPPILRKTTSVPITKALLEELNRRRVFFDKRDGHQRLIGAGSLFVPDGAFVEPYTAFWTGRSMVQMGSFSYSFSDFPAHTIRIGRYCSIAGHVVVMGTSHPYDYLTTSACLYEKGVNFVQSAFEDENVEGYVFSPNPQKAWPTVGHDVWLGQDVTVGRNLTVGNGSIVGSNSLVTKDVPPYAIVGGNPARIIKYRFSEAIIERLQALQWWQYFFPHISHLSLRDPDKFCGELEDLVASGKISPWEPQRLDVAALARELSAQE
jgi:acetyltransferase-like isoleucine patch superfamily enzyme